MGWVETLLEISVVLLLVVALPMVIRLERTLAAVRRDRAALENGANGLTEATRLADAASIRLRAAAEGGGRQLAERLAAAEPLRDDLRYLFERAEAMADRLELLVRQARPVAQEAPVAETLAGPARSGAELSLLRALRAGR